MPVAPHIAQLREQVGHDLLLLPSVAVLPIDESGRVLLARQTDFGTYATVGGAIDVDESPLDAAHREAREEIGSDVVITGLMGAVGGPEFRITYPNGDQTAYVCVVYEAKLSDAGALHPDGVEVDQVRWFQRIELNNPEVGPFAQATFRAIGWI
ncbi:NUDIX domain-containing protein [Ornithinimicrobium pratense]|uniref:NUDIX domain-containing protein n=1 Tax=Ornithinimicrobium pratense TaxID=2593973 RepID=A0A5J6V2H8_9MICO|nr:NUDIX domain-containing protein [Ornithinimicrobium pratense]QFG67466.1 NUDIX domain-containing protein [Ornithinimicrobium pratense]